MCPPPPSTRSSLRGRMWERESHIAFLKLLFMMSSRFCTKGEGGSRKIALRVFLKRLLAIFLVKGNFENIALGFP